MTVSQTARRSVLVLVAVTVLAGCATAAPTRRTAEASEAPRRCSPADPDRWAWFCVVGQILYGAASFFTPPNETATR